MLKVKDKYKSYLQTRTGIDNYNAFKSILYTDSDTLIQTLFSNHISKLKLTSDISICDAGGGDGKRIIELIKKINQQFRTTIHLDFIEQSDFMCSDFEAQAKKIENFCEVQVHNKEVEDTFLIEKFDIVLLIHSIFCFPDFSVFQKLFDRLKSDGVLYVISNSTDSFLANIKRELDLQYEDKRYEIENLLSDLNKNEIDFVKDSFKTEWALYDNEVDGKLAIILEWLSLGAFQSYAKTKQIEVIELAKGLAKQNNNQYSFSEKEEVLIIKR